MAFETNSALNPNDLLDKIRVFLIAQGWTQDFWALEGANRRLHLHKGGWYLNAKASNDASNIWYSSAYPTYAISLNLGTALNTGNPWWNQTGVPVITATTNGLAASLPLVSGAIVGYQFFYDPTYDSFLAYVEVASGVWRWIGFGLTLEKAGTWTGGPWMFGCAHFFYLNYGPGSSPGNGASFASVYPFGAVGAAGTGNPLGYVRADVDAFTGSWVGLSPTAGVTGKAGGSNVAGYTTVSSNVPASTGLVDRTRNAMNSLSALLPVQVYVDRDAGGKSLLGNLPGVFTANASGLVSGQAYTVGPDTFVPFPADTPTRATVLRKV